MDLFAVDVISRLLHILGAILLFGGALFVNLVLRPSVTVLSEEQHETLHAQVMKRWRQYVGLAIGLLIFTGFYNYLMVTAPEHGDAGDKKYHMFMGIKILLAFVVFFLASVLPGRAKAFEKLRENPKVWATLTLVLAAVVVAIASFLKMRGIPTA